MNKNKQIKLLVNCASLFARNRVCNEGSLLEWWKIVKFCHFKGFLYTGFCGDSIDLVVIAYRTPTPTPSFLVTIPDSEKGNTLYVCAVSSDSKDSKKLLRLMRWYLREHPDVTQIVYHRRNSNDFKIHPLRRKDHGRIVKT